MGVESTLPPGPKSPPLLQAANLGRLPRFLDACHQRYGDRFTVRMGRFGTFVYLVDPDDIRSVFHGDDAALHAGEANAPFLGRVLGPSSVLVTEPAKSAKRWLRGILVLNWWTSPPQATRQGMVSSLQVSDC